MNPLIGCLHNPHITHIRPAYPKILLSILRTAYVRIFRFLTRLFCGCTTNQSKQSSVKGICSNIRLVRTVCELTFSIIQTHYTRTTLFCLHLQKLDRLVGLVVKASASRAEGPGFESRSRRDFFGVESYQWLKNWHSSGYPARRLAL